MAKVGMQKQAQYDQGVQKIQQSIDNIAGLDISKPGHKQYLQSKLNELGGKLRTVTGGDFSNQQLVNSVSGMTSSLIKDPIIQNAVYSTQKLRKGAAEMEDAKKKGTLTPQNKFMFENAANTYLNDSNLETQFDGSYENFFDTQKFASETFSKVTKGKIKWEDIYERNADGSPKIQEVRDKKGRVISSEFVISPTMKTHIQEGILPDVVKNTISQIMNDPRVSRQLDIDGQYTYRTLNGQNLSDMAISQKERLLDSANDKLLGLLLDKNTGKDVQDDIDATKLHIQNINTKYDSIAKLSLLNPNAIKGMLYKDSFVDNTTSMYGTMTNEIDTKENPAWNQNFKLTQAANDIKLRQQQMAQTMIIHKEDLAARKKLAKEGFQNQITLAQIRGAKGAGQMVDTDGDGIVDTFVPGAGTGGGGGLIPELDENPADFGTYYNKFISDVDTSADAFSSAQNNLIWDTTLSLIGNNKADLDKLISAGIPKQQAINQLINNAGKGAKDGIDGFKTRWSYSAMNKINKMSPVELSKNSSLLDAKTNYNIAKTTFDKVNSFKNKLDEDVATAVGKEAYESSILKTLTPVKGIYKGKEFTLRPQDQLDLALYVKGYASIIFDTSGIIDKGVREAADAAGQRLSAKGLGFLLDQALRKSGATVALDGGLITGAIRGLQGVKSMIGSGFSKLATGEYSNADVDLDPVMKTLKNLNSDTYSKVFTQTQKRLEQHYNIDPNLKLSVLSGDSETDKGIMMNLRRLASGATQAGKNLSPDLDQFAKALDDDDFGLKKGSIEAKIINGATNNPMVEIVAGTPSEGRKGGMVISIDVAKNLGLNIDGIYEPTDVRLLKNLISQRGGQTSAGNPRDKNTYRNNDVQFTMNNFTQLSQFKDALDVRANVIQRNGKYYGEIYIKDNKGKEVLRETEGDESLQRLESSLLGMNVNTINMLLNE
jgi:hypothetical protein